MLKKADKNLKSLSIALKNENFRTLSKSWKEKFDMIICMTTSFPHNSTDKEAIETLKSMYSCLNKGGIVVIDNGFADSFFKTKPKFIPARIHKDQAFYFFLEYPNPKKVIFNILNVKKHRRVLIKLLNQWIIWHLEKKSLKISSVRQILIESNIMEIITLPSIQKIPARE